MLTPNLIILYVDNPKISATFYSELLGHPPAAVYPTYAAFEFGNGLSLGLWSSKAQDFVSGGKGHLTEISFMEPTVDKVRHLYDRWVANGVRIEQPLHEAVFGLTFVALDPDGHRIRVCMPDAE